MKTIAFNGSPRPEGNTNILLKTTLKVIEEAGIETELVQIGEVPLSGCTACGNCIQAKDGKCSIDTDPMNEWIQKIVDADAVLIGSPTYFSDLTANTKAFIERAGYVSRVNNNLFARKLGSAVVAVRRAGAISVMNSINYFFLANQMIVVGSSYWPIGIGRAPGDVLNDQEGIDTMKQLGTNIAWLLNRTHNQ